MRSTLQYGRNVRLNESWHQKIPGGLPDERILEEIGEFYPKYFFDLLSDPIIKNVGKQWQNIIRTHITASVYEVASNFCNFRFKVLIILIFDNKF